MGSCLSESLCSHHTVDYFFVFFKMSQSEKPDVASKSRDYLVMVREKKDGSRTETPMPDETASTPSELRLQKKRIRLHLQETSKKLKAAVADEPKSGPVRGYKRPPWAENGAVMVRMVGSPVRKDIPVELTDTWQSVEENAAFAHGVDAGEYDIHLVAHLSMTRVLKKGSRPSEVGEFSVWDGSLVLKKKKPTVVQETGGDSSGGGDDSDSDEAAPFTDE